MTSRLPVFPALVAILALSPWAWSCGDTTSTEPEDAAAADGGSDAGVRSDASAFPDAGAPDAETPDADTPDADTPDARADAEVVPDAALDGGEAPDGGADAASSDADAHVNAAPTASAGADLVMLARRRVSLAGVASDADGDSLTTSWTQLSGPPAVLDDPSSLTPSFWARYAGTYVFALHVSDGTAEVSDEVRVLVHDINGGDHTIALKPDGTLWAWGDNGVGELGTGDTITSTTPVRVCDTGASDCASRPLTGVIAISTGRAHTLALKAD